MKKNRFREADPIVEENNINEAPTQASPQEVVDAQANVDAPMEGAVDSTIADDTTSEPMMDTPQEDIEVPEGSMDVPSADMGGDLGDGASGMSVGDSAPEFGEGVKVNPETVSMEIQVPTEQLASAVAQATGDVVPAETAPDIEMAKEEELVAQQNEPAEQDTDMNTEAPSPLEAEDSIGEDSMEQSVPVESLDTNNQQQPQTMEESKKMSPSKKVDIRFKKKLDGIVKKGSENMAKSLKESLHDDDFESDMPAGLEIDEDSVYFEGKYVGFIANPENCIYVSIEKCDEAEEYFLDKDWVVKKKYDFGKPLYESEGSEGIETEENLDSDVDTLDYEGLPEGYADENERDESLENTFQDVSDEDVSEFMGRLQGYLDNEETTPQEVSDALRTSADFMDMVGGETPSNTPLMDTIKDTEDLDFDSLIDGEYEDKESRDEALDTESPNREEDDFEEALVRKPCKFPKDKTSIKESKERVGRLKETQIIESYDLLDGRYKPWSGAVDTWNTLEELDLLESFDDLLDNLYPEGLSETELNDLLWFERDWILESLGVTDENGDSKFIDDDLEESKKVVNKQRIKESRKPLVRTRLKEGSEDKLEIKDLEPLNDTVKVVEIYEDGSCKFTVDIATSEYEVVAPYEGTSVIKGTLTGTFFADFNEGFIDDSEDEEEQYIEDIISCLPSYLTIKGFYSIDYSKSDREWYFTMGGKDDSIGVLDEPDNYYFEINAFEGYSIDIKDVLEEGNFEESKKAHEFMDSKLKESSEIIYPAGSVPSESSALYKRATRKDSNLVKAHEKVIRRRREALKDFHESVKRPTPIRNKRFNEALRSPLSYNDLGNSNLNNSAWKNNKFIDKYEESQKLDFNVLLNEGYLG